VPWPYGPGTDIGRQGPTPEGKQQERCRAWPDRGRALLLEDTSAGHSPEGKRQMGDRARTAGGMRATARGDT
jgi:hypothetical protein